MTLRRILFAVSAIAILAVLGGGALFFLRLGKPRVVVAGAPFVLAPNESAILGTLAVAFRRDTSSRDEYYLLVLHEGTQTLARDLVGGAERFKFGAYSVSTTPRSSPRSITVDIAPWKPTSPIAPGDAAAIAEEAHRDHCGGRAICDEKEARQSNDAKQWTVRCDCPLTTDSAVLVGIDATGGAVLSKRFLGGA